MRIFVRADASGLIGSGHIVRCRTLATALERRGAAVEFICRSHGGEAARLLRTSGLRVHYLPATGTVSNASGPYAHWLGATEVEDAEQTIELLGSQRPDWLVVDHYALSDAWERALRPHAKKVLAIDDLGRTHAVDALLDQNFLLDPQGRYRGRLPPECRLMLGPHFALLHESYEAARSPRDPMRPVRRVAIFFGGVDPNNFTGLTVAALDQPSFKSITLDVILGTSNSHAEAIAAYTPAHVGLRLHHALPSLAGVLASADLAIGAGGGSTWERCCLGVPSIVLSLADNQTPASEALGQSGVVKYLGPGDRVGPTEIQDAVRALIDDPALRRSMSEQGRLLVDGRGAARVAESLAPTTPSRLTLRPANETDRDYLFHLANEPEVRAQSFSTERITWEHHKQWYAAKLADPAAHIFILEAQGLPTGMIRFEIMPDHAVLNYALDMVGRGRKWGHTLVDLGLRSLAARWTGDVRAFVKKNNLPSCAVFERLLFRACETHDQQNLYVLDARDLKERFGRGGPGES